MNKFRRFIGRILSEICLKMDYFGSKSPKIAKRWVLVDADDWPFFGKIKLIFYIFCPPCPKNVSAPL